MRGPKVVCNTCHYAPPTVIGGSALTPPKHVNMALDFKDGATSKSATTVCATCHSAGGSYDAIDDATIGAKTNWRQGVYTGDLLKGSKKKWCAGCHDEAASPSTISGVVAPPVAGDESSTTFYGATGYGFFKTGHGLPLDQVYPWTGEPMARQGAGLGCDACHDFSREHIDGEPRTYESPYTDPAESGEHMLGYRLKTVDGSVPIEIPRRSVAFDSGDQVKASDFRLCFSCHVQTGFTIQPVRPQVSGTIARVRPSTLIISTFPLGTRSRRLVPDHSSSPTGGRSFPPQLGRARPPAFNAITCTDPRDYR